MNLKKSNGITLIALVITIIVLLILAGVSISSLTGENGIINKAKKAKEETELAEVREKVDLAVQAAMVKGEGELTEDLLREELDSSVQNYKLEKVTGGWKITVDNHELTVSANGDFSDGEGEIRNINVEISQTTGEELWNNIVTLNVTLEDVNTELSLEQKQELAAYMLDYADYEDLKTNLTTLSGQTLENIIAGFGLADEAEFVDVLVNAMFNSLSYDDVNKLEELGVPVITITTPYNTKLYTNALDNRELKIGFVENGSYDFKIQSGGTTITETVEISNIRDYSTETPYEVNIEADFGGVPVLYKMDEETEYTSLQEGILESNGAITLKLDDNGQPNVLSYVVKDEEYFKYFADGSWTLWHGWFNGEVGLLSAYITLQNAEIPEETLKTMTSRQVMMYAAFLDNDIALQILNLDMCDGTWFDFLNEGTLPTLREEEIDRSILEEKYPQIVTGFTQVLKSPDDTETINLTSDTCIYIYAQDTTL